jgi:DNA-directed RNA polymerase specialized sigma24 family protein
MNTSAPPPPDSHAPPAPRASMPFPRLYDQPDATLLERARAGCQDSLNALLSRHWPPLAACARHSCGNCGFVEDLCQEAMLNIVRHLAEFRTERDFQPWARSFVSYEIRHCRRKCKKVGTHGLRCASDQIMREI